LPIARCNRAVKTEEANLHMWYSHIYGWGFLWKYSALRDFHFIPAKQTGVNQLVTKSTRRTWSQTVN